jgi:hypothetical protein
MIFSNQREKWGDQPKKFNGNMNRSIMFNQQNNDPPRQPMDINGVWG